MAMTKHNNQKNDNFILNTIEELVPQEHLVRKLEKSIDWTFIYPMVEELYSEIGRPSIDPVILFKMIFINYLFGINSMRKTCEEIKVNLAYRWFLGLAMDDSVPNYSTWSQNYIRRYNESSVFNEIFQRIIEEAIKHKFIDTSTVYGDSTHQKACANKRRAIDKEVKIVKKNYEDDLLKEINEVRRSHGKKEIKSLDRKEITFDEESGEVKENIKTKHIKESITDPECGLFHKGEKEKCFAYSHQTFCEGNGFVLEVKTYPGNVHDSVSFFGAYDELYKKYQGIKNVVLDSGYNTPAITRAIIRNNQTPYLPYKRPMTKKGFFKKYQFVYDEQFDEYLCPGDSELKYTTTNKQGYKEYKSDPGICEKCPLKDQCTSSKNNQKVITRHVWAEYKEQAEEVRGMRGFKDIYRERKQTIERVFADDKEQHGLRFTRLKGLKKNQNQALIIFSCHNIKKLAKWGWKSDKKESKNNLVFSTVDSISQNLHSILFFFTKKVACTFKQATLSTI